MLVALIIAAACGASYLLYRFDEPQSRWLWCQILSTC